MKPLRVLCLVVMLIAPVHAERVRQCVRLGETYGWFSSNPDKLKADVDKYLADAGDVKVEGTPVAIVAPHAGYRYSGRTAGYAFKPVKGRRYARVVVLAPSHHVGFTGGSIPDVDAYGTPLGNIPLDKPACRKLLATESIRSIARAHRKEHSLQAELPFLQRTLAGDWKLVPIVIGAQQQPSDIEKLADAVKSVLTPDTLIVVSSDFTHYGRSFHYQPFTTDIRNNLRKLDRGAIDCICNADGKAFRDYITKTRATICGRKPIAVMLKIFEGRTDVRGTLLHYEASGDRTKDYRHSVSYAAIVMTKRDARPEATGDVKVIADDEPGDAKTRDEIVPADKLNLKERKLLLTMARAQLEKVVKDGKAIDPRKYGWDLNKKLLSQGAVFVTLKNKGRLRGCIGTIIPVEPLYLNVLRNTINAARRDRRFRRNRITVRELPQIDIEISYLTPPKRVGSYTDIVVGTHGVILQKGGRRSVFLPQVAPEQGWDRATMLTHLARKAGLRGDAWKKGCTFDVFEAHVFGEKEHGKPEAKTE